MNTKLQTVLLDLLVILGLRRQPQLQPIPVHNHAVNPKGPRH
ncbi:hypothetical protein OU997_17595 [Pseudomonas sp. SL4(2022)]|nr:MULTISPECIES: PA1414 family protein [unclassified Pseudomonas]WAC44034.1 hypothetical protein OU997_17595 [Pseudomonas sp. SL4(2022)]